MIWKQMLPYSTTYRSAACERKEGGNGFKHRTVRPQLRLKQSRPSPRGNRYKKEEIHLSTNLLK